jgi:hypothetical protein
MKHQIPASLRRPESRAIARQMADSILRADARRQRAAALPQPTTKKAPPVEIGPRRLHLSDLKRALVARDSRLQSATNRAGGSRRNTNGQ